MKQYVVLHGQTHDNTFFTLSREGDTHEGYDILGYVDTCDEADELITEYTGKTAHERTIDYILKMARDINSLNDMI